MAVALEAVLSAGQLGERDGDLLGQDQLGVGGQGRVRIPGMWRSSGRAAWRLPDTYHTAGIRRDRHLAPTKPGTTSRTTWQPCPSLSPRSASALTLGGYLVGGVADYGLSAILAVVV